MSTYLPRERSALHSVSPSPSFQVASSAQHSRPQGYSCVGQSHTILQLCIHEPLPHSFEASKHCRAHQDSLELRASSSEKLTLCTAIHLGGLGGSFLKAVDGSIVTRQPFLAGDVVTICSGGQRLESQRLQGTYHWLALEVPEVPCAQVC